MEETYIPKASKGIYTLLDDDPSMILLLKNSAITDDMWRFCIQRDTSLFQEMKHPSEKLCLFALSEDGRNLEYIVNKFTDIKLTNKMIWTAITSQPSAINLVPKKLLTNQMKEYAYKLDPSLMSGDDEIRSEFLFELIGERPSYIKYIKHPSDKLLTYALERDPNVIVYITEFTPYLRELIQTQYPEFASLVPPLKNQSESEDNSDETF